MTVAYLNFAGECWRYALHQTAAPFVARWGSRVFVRTGRPGALTIYHEVCG